MRLKFPPRKFKKIEAVKRVEDKQWQKREAEVIVRQGKSDTQTPVVEPIGTESLIEEE